MPGRRNYGKLSGNRCLQDRSSHMPPPAPLGTGDAWAEAAQSTNSCSRRHGKYLFCFAAIVQVLLNLLGLHSMLTMVPRKRITTPAPPAAHVPRAAPAPRAAPGSFSCSGSSSCSGLLQLLRLLELLRASSAAPAPRAALGSFGCARSCFFTRLLSRQNIPNSSESYCTCQSRVTPFFVSHLGWGHPRTACL
jgi:hypothetical protein